MKKLIFLIPFVLIFFSCGDVDSPAVNSANPNSDTSSVPSGTGDSGDVTNPEGSGGSGTTTGEGGNTGGETNPEGEGGGDTTVDVTDPKGDGNDNTTVVVDPGGGTGGDTTVVVDPGGITGGEIVIIQPDEEELKLIHNTIFDYINRDNLYYRSTLSENDRKIYDRIYDSLVSFYGRTDEEEEECTAGVLCHATDVFIETKCIDDKTGYELTNLSKEDREYCTPEEVQKQYDAWADSNCINMDTGEARLNSSGVPVCGWNNYNYKFGEFNNKNIVGVPVGFLDMANELSQISNLPKVVGALYSDLPNLFPYVYYHRVGKNDLYFKLIPYQSYNVSSDAELKEKWISDMNYIQERVYYSIINYTKTKEQDFDYFLLRFKQTVGKGNSYEYAEDGAKDISGILAKKDGKTAKFNAHGLSSLLTFACQIGTNFQCTYVNGAAAYDGKISSSYAWVKVKNDNILSSCNGDIIIDPVRFYEDDTIPYLCSSDVEGREYF